MSLNRTALRLAAVMALTNGFRAPFPTRAAERVYDSRMDPLVGLDEMDLVPMIIVTSEDHAGDKLSHTSGGPPFDNHVDLVLDISIGMHKEGEVYAIQSEPELEAALDLMEWQAQWALLRDPGSAWQPWFWGSERSVCLQVAGWRSNVFREREAMVRLSARQVILQCKLAPDEDLRIGEAAGAPIIPAPLGPLLDAVINDGGPYAMTAEATREIILGSNVGLTANVLTPLHRIRLIESVQAARDDDHDVPAGLRADGVGQANLS